MLIVYCPGCGRATLEQTEARLHVRCLSCLEHWIIQDACEALMESEGYAVASYDFMTEEQEFHVGRDMQALQRREEERRKGGAN